ncbi:hypothetical protein NQZ79_g2275 [Umbelopsis isabellina]|nr:hypothetical protein NQZ79_g2275 [Umbelopsis isabellina]
MSSRIPMYDSSGSNKDIYNTTKVRRYQQFGQTDKALVDIPANLLPTNYNPAGQENVDQQKLPKRQYHGIVSEKAPLRAKTAVLGNADKNIINNEVQIKPPQPQRAATSESKYIIPDNIYDKKTGETYKKMRYFGEGGFAICYEAENSRQQRFALKVVAKRSLRDHKLKTKFLAEINIHRSLKHPGIVRFHSCFEDSQNAYLVLELCENYANNILLDYKMDAKLSDFGLAAILVNAEERKRTICGTPNYMAPEILYGKTGHNQQADIWSLGVLFYTMLVGTPPFHESSHDAIYQNNRIMPSYTFPEDIRISDNAKEVISSLLVNDPEKRPSIKKLLSFPFFKEDFLPAVIPICALKRPPTELDFARYANASKAVTSPDNAAAALQRASQRDEIYARKPRAPLENLELLSERLTDPRQMLRTQSSRSNWNISNVPGSTFSEAERHSKRSRTQYAEEYDVSPGNVASKIQALESKTTEKLSPSQSRSTSTSTGTKKTSMISPQERLSSKSPLPRSTLVNLQVSKSPKPQETDHLLERLRQTTTSLSLHKKETNSSNNFGNALSLEPALPVDDYVYNDAENVVQYMYEAIESLLSSKHRVQTIRKSHQRADEERMVSGIVFIDRWVDFTHKYGLGYCLSDGSNGVYFNDATTLVTKVDTDYVSFVCNLSEDAPDYVKPESFRVTQYPHTYRKKMTLLQHYQKYMYANLMPIAKNLPASHKAQIQQAIYLENYMQTDRAAIFLLSNNIIQINFWDHTKLVLCDIESIIYVNSSREWSVRSLVASDLDDEVLSRLEYAHEVLHPDNRAPLITKP